MASEQTLLDAMGKAMDDPTPTQTDWRAQQLAFALGYPLGWRVVRSLEDVPATVLMSHQQQPTKCIVDRIYAGRPGSGCDGWFHHAAARQAAYQLSLDPDTDLGGGHLTKRLPKFEKNMKVEVLYEGEWWTAKILRRTEKKQVGFVYQVQYPQDKTKQSGVPERIIRHISDQVDPQREATKLGLPAGWLCWPQPGNKIKISGPDGTTYTSKRAAVEAHQAATKETGDPPWRKSGHDLVGRTIVWTTQHAVSARRTITIEQLGVVAGWIAATDVDRAGQPGYVSEATGKPTALFHVVFNDDPLKHPYGSHLVDYQDMEQREVEERLVDDGKFSSGLPGAAAEGEASEEPPAKKQKTDDPLKATENSFL